ncbi:MAG: AP2 domain-containing protein [Calditrichia bacterium]
MSTVFSSKGISRIEQPEKFTFGWYVRVRYKGKVKSKFFSDKKHGDRAKAFMKARSFYKQQMKKVLGKIAGEPVDHVPDTVIVTQHKSNNTGIVGIQKIKRKRKTGGWYKAYRVAWKENGKVKTKFFSVEKYGEKEAFQLARNLKTERLLNSA